MFSQGRIGSKGEVQDLHSCALTSCALVGGVVAVAFFDFVDVGVVSVVAVVFFDFVIVGVVTAVHLAVVCLWQTQVFV